MSDRYCGIKLLWSWDYRFWSWFTSHGIHNGWATNGDRLFDKVYHLGPLKLFIGILK